MMEIKLLSAAEIASDLLDHFHHRQVIRRKWVKKETWEQVDTEELREWDREKRRWLPEYLLLQLAGEGAVAAAYSGSLLIGFCALDGCLSGEKARYANLTMLFVDDGWQRQGVGTALFRCICEQARQRNADKLFISAIPSVETVAFYFYLGCKDAAETVPDFIDTEEDRFLEYSLNPSV